MEGLNGSLKSPPIYRGESNSPLCEAKCLELQGGSQTLRVQKVMTPLSSASQQAGKLRYSPL